MPATIQNVTHKMRPTKYDPQNATHNQCNPQTVGTGVLDCPPQTCPAKRLRRLIRLSAHRTARG
uniref:Uncharacterized protein n=1 Tax=Inoviridae sp. ct4fI15 TaxID=2825776 RepID=A0A8S5UKF4_9VIRU|nr:MAG TPA: hypothetical protein [Inoviridae sp. ct4fI15]